MGVGIAQLRESLGGYAAGFDAAALTAGQAEHVVEQASKIENIAATLKALAAGRLAETDSWRAGGDRSVAHLLARYAGSPVVQATSALETARRLADLPEVAAAARRGELSAEQTAAIADAASASPGAEHDLVEAARQVPLSELRERCARAKATAAVVDAEARRVRIHARRSLRSYTDSEGEWHLHCRNNPEVGAQIMAALDPIRDEVFRRARAENRHQSPDAYGADALTEMSRRSGASDPSPAGVEATNGAPVLKRSSATPKIIVRVDLEALLRGRPVDEEVCEIAGFGPVAVSAVRDMIDSDDPFLTAVATRGKALVGVAHLGRRPNAAQQTALQWLYPSCANQACTAQARLDYDHRVDWSATHVTVIDFLDRLCSHCHALKTRQNWSLVEGRSKRSFVPPHDLRHPRYTVDPRVNGPPP